MSRLTYELMLIEIQSLTLIEAARASRDWVVVDIKFILYYSQLESHKTIYFQSIPFNLPCAASWAPTV